MNKLVSILIPVYNRATLVGETIQSAINQTYKNIEIIIVDNCSTDNTWEVVKQYALKDDRIKIFQNAENIGPVRNWKRCIDEAKGEYAKILFSDDLIKDTFVEKTMQLFDNDTAFVLTGREIFGSINDKNNLYLKKQEYTSEEYLREKLLYEILNIPGSPGCAIFRTIDLKNSLLIDIPNDKNLNFSKYGAGNDLLLFLITATKYPKIKVVKSIESFFRAHNNSFTFANDLAIYYNYSKYYFITHYFTSILPKYKARNAIIDIWKTKTLSWNNVKQILLNTPFCIKFLFKKALKKIIR